LTYQGAVDGLGVAIAQKALVAEDIASGRIAAPSDIEVHNPLAYFLVYPSRRAKLAKVQAFQSWIANEAGLTRRADAAL
jgi:LysR family glycine cleavage system transcriptional activator